MAADEIAHMFRKEGVNHFMIDISGEILFSGQKSEKHWWVAGVETPQDSLQKKLALAFNVKDEAVATSGTYRQFYDEAGQRRSHIIDPRTGKPVAHRTVSVTVMAPTCAAADALSTALLVLGEDQGMSLAKKLDLKVVLQLSSGGQTQLLISPAMENYLKLHKFE